MRRNQELAALFHSIAESLTGPDANPYRVRAYRRAAAAILSLKEDIASIAQRGALRTIPGIGRELSAKIEEFLATGTIDTSSSSVEPLPPDIAAWTKLPGLSERLVRYLYKQLGIRSTEDLEALVRSHMLRTLPGVRLDEDQLLSAIQAHREARQSG